MTFTEYREKLETIKYLSQRRRKDTVDTLAERLNISRRTATRIVQQFRKRGFSITYNRLCYIYEVKNVIEKTW